MSKNRIIFSDDVVLISGNVGINTGQPDYRLEVNGTVYSTNDFRVTGDATFSGYDGFLKSSYQVDESITLSANHGQTSTLSSDTVVATGSTITVPEGSVSGSSTVKTLKVKDAFTAPTGGTEDRPQKPKQGQFYFNKDFASIEFWDGNVWRQVDNTTQRGRGLFGNGGNATPYGKTIEYFNISTTGNSSYFGDLRNEVYSPGAFASSTRGIWAAGRGGTPIIFQSTIDYVTIASEGNYDNFGSLTAGYVHTAGLSSSTRGIIGGGFSNVNTIDYVTISQLGNALDFGDLSVGRHTHSALASPTRGIFTGGNGPGSKSTYCDYITISSKGDAVFFGNLISEKEIHSSCSNSIRGITFGGYDISEALSLKQIEFLTISSLGSSENFGEISSSRYYGQCSSNSTRAVYGGGTVAPGVYTNSMEYVTIASAGNAIDFGDLIISRAFGHGCSDSHGGLGGF